MYSRILMQATSGKYKASLVWVSRDHKTEVKFIWIELIECTDLLIAEARKVMMPKISPVSHTIFAHSKQQLHSKKKRPSREHWCGTGQIPSEDQVRTILTTLEC